MFTLVQKHIGNDHFMQLGPARVAARKLVQKTKESCRILAWTKDVDDMPMNFIETIEYVPPAPRDVTALTKEIFG